MSTTPAAGRKSFAVDTSWDELGWNDLGGGITSSRFVLGDPDDPQAPMVFRTFFPPGCRVEAHRHSCDYAEIILEGTQQVSGKWHKAGDVRYVVGKRGYGPLIAGPEGVHVIVIFRRQDFETIFGKKQGYVSGGAAGE
jgi:hypothetical protein